ncbi:tripartite tricarboxylate transporter substrate binding protein, partial [Siccirubricoccus sp. KC 17139]|nr:tripartite tricarboxylate transporter substrate binding protein [Siccirubricoccus soli]MCP2685917.1 tripartite tricarboxylate transporter substrate binding protein [Siccirubricoccus soli]
MPASLGRRAVLALPLAAPALAPGLARASDIGWPTRPVRIVISWPPGGGADIPMRLAAPAMQQVLGQTLVLENRA